MLSALPHVYQRLEAVIVHGQPMHVGWPILAARTERDDVVYLKAGTRATYATGRGTGVVCPKSPNFLCRTAIR